MASNGGPAFPTIIKSSSSLDWTERGMHLRDYFAGKALIGLLQQDRAINDTLARDAYRIADFMIQQKENG